MVAELIIIIGISYCLFVLGKSVIKRILTIHSCIHILFLLGFYLQGLRLWFIGELSADINLTMIYIFIGHFFFEAGWIVSYGSSMRKPAIIREEISSFRLFLVIICLSLLGALSWVFLFYFFVPGGAFNFVTSEYFASRVSIFRGMGAVLILFSFLTIANLIFFAYLFLNHEKLRYKKLLYATFVIHAIFLWCLTIPFGQRGGIITPIILWGLVITLNKKYSLKFFFVAGLSILILINVLGTLRTYKEKSFDKSISTWDYVVEGYGFANRLEACVGIVNGVPHALDFQYGKTYFALLTQFVPRNIWPDKWDTGGVLITKYILADHSFSSRSNYQGTLFGEAYLNFALFGLIFVPFLVGYFVGFIDRKREQVSNILNAVILSYWSYTCLLLVNGDFVNTMFSGLITWAVLLLVKIFVISRPMSKKIGKKFSPGRRLPLLSAISFRRLSVKTKNINFQRAQIRFGVRRTSGDQKAVPH